MVNRKTNVDNFANGTLHGRQPRVLGPRRNSSNGKVAFSPRGCHNGGDERDVEATFAMQGLLRLKS